jgi:hypothetical protein
MFGLDVSRAGIGTDRDINMDGIYRLKLELCE